MTGLDGISDHDAVVFEDLIFSATTRIKMLV